VVIGTRRSESYPPQYWRSTPWTAASAAPDLRTGSIIILASEQHLCRHLKFDNVTGKARDEGTGGCIDPAASRLVHGTAA
jgi:hypothetical protein